MATLFGPLHINYVFFFKKEFYAQAVAARLEKKRFAVVAACLTSISN